MPKQVSAEELDRILQAVGQHPEGVGIDQLLTLMGLDLPRRTLQRRLAQLVTEQRLFVEGKARGVRYKPAPMMVAEANIIFPSFALQGEGETYVPVSREGGEIKAYVRQPAQSRKPVGYNHHFLEAYQPNQTFYLPEKLRSQLRRLGEPPEKDRPAGTFARDILGRLLIDLSWASSRLEGNTYTRLDTERLIDFGVAAEGKDVIETQMILNHKAAIELLVNEAGQIGFFPQIILNLHALLSDGLLADPRACGRIRERAVGIGGSVYHPLALPQRLEELFAVILDMAQEIADPFEQSFFAMVHIPYLQPFEDVNKRVARLAANIPLIRHDLCPLSFLDVPERAYIDAMLGVYELNRIELLRDVFVWAYERSCQQYVAVERQFVPPDMLRLRYRKELSAVIRDMVAGRLPLNAQSVRPLVPTSLPQEDMAKFVQLVLDELLLLYDGNAMRFGLRPLEVAVWRKDLGLDQDN